MMADPNLLLRRILLQKSPPSISSSIKLCIAAATARVSQSCYSTDTESSAELKNHENSNNRGKWVTLPIFNSAAAINGTALGKALSSAAPAESASETTALKWVIRCCPEIPRNLVQKLFRLRQVRRESSSLEEGNQERSLIRVGAKDSMNIGDRIFLPFSVQAEPSEKKECYCTEEDVKFIRGLELYKDSAIIVINKPPGLPVQGGIGIKTSLDELSVTCLSYDYKEPPRLVHRLDRDSSGILVMGRTQTSATVLHSIFREKTSSTYVDVDDKRRILQRKYLALVIGSPKKQKGIISAPLGKVVVDNGKSDRITVVRDEQNMSSQHAVTQYRVIESSRHGYTWLELSPLTGRKHQLRVHCAEILRTPIVGDYKYAWQTHKNWKHLPWSDPKDGTDERPPNEKTLPFGLDLESGSVSEKHPRLHLHCKQMVIPNVVQALQDAGTSTGHDFSKLERLQLDAPLPPYMKRSWDILRSLSHETHDTTSNVKEEE